MTKLPIQFQLYLIFHFSETLLRKHNLQPNILINTCKKIRVETKPMDNGVQSAYYYKVNSSYYFDEVIFNK